MSAEQPDPNGECLLVAHAVLLYCSRTVVIRRSYFGDEGIGIAATVLRLNSMFGDWEIGRTREPAATA